MMDAEPSTKAKILIIDDEPSIVSYLSAVLEDHGYATVSATNGREGLAQVEAEHPDLVCLDITMPDTSGIRFYQNLRDDPANAHVKVVVVTAMAGAEGDPEPFKRFLNTRSQFTPPDEFVSKPIDPEAFVKTIAEVLSR